MKLRCGAAILPALILAACAHPVVHGTSAQSLQADPRVGAMVHVLHATHAQYQGSPSLAVCEAAELLRTSPEELRGALRSSGLTMPLLPGCRPTAGQPANYLFVLNLRSLCNFTIVDFEYVAPSGEYRSDEYQLGRSIGGWQVFQHSARTDTLHRPPPVQPLAPAPGACTHGGAGSAAHPGEVEDPRIQALARAMEYRAVRFPGEEPDFAICEAADSLGTTREAADSLGTTREALTESLQRLQVRAPILPGCRPDVPRVGNYVRVTELSINSEGSVCVTLIYQNVLSGGRVEEYVFRQVNGGWDREFMMVSRFSH